MLLFQFLGEELMVIFTYFYLQYAYGGMVFILGPVARGSNFIRSQGSADGRRAVLRMHTDEISALLLDVRVHSHTVVLMLSLTCFSYHSYW
jgi:hypothetical protein